VKHEPRKSPLPSEAFRRASERQKRGPEPEPTPDPQPKPTAQPSVEDPPPTVSLIAELEQFLRRFVLLPEAGYLPVAVWIIGTHVSLKFDCFAYLAILSPAKRCGKTRLLELIELFSERPWRGTAPSAAALFRMMANAPTLLLDENEALNQKNPSESSQAILAILNAGHRKGATIPRCDGPSHALKFFPVYGPKAFAAIGKLPDVLMDRSIIIPMQRRAQDQKLERFRSTRAPKEAKPIRDRLAQFCKSHEAAINDAYQRWLDKDLDYLGDRDADLWIPLFALCELTAPDRVEDLKKNAQQLCNDKAEEDLEESLALTLLRDIRGYGPSTKRSSQIKHWKV
jgi:hypothetical protein